MDTVPPPPPSVPPPDPQRCCRFCLREPNMYAMRRISTEQLPLTDLPELFEILTAIKLDISGGYSEWMCDECEHRMRQVAQWRADFRRVARQWKDILLGQTTSTMSGECVAISGAVGWDSECRMKTEQVDDTTSSAIVLEMKFERKEQEMDRLEPQLEDECTAATDDNHDDDEHHISDSNLSDSEASSSRKSSAAVRTKRKSGRSADTSYSTDGNASQVLATPLGCDICGASIANRQLLLRHMRTAHHFDPSTTCHICGKTNLKRLGQHLRDHRKTDRYRCAHCPKTFCRLAMKEQHERQHTGERPYICEVCAFTFTSPAALKRHARRHTDPHALTLSTNGTVIEQPQHRVQAHRRRIEPLQLVPKLPPRAGIRLECPLCHNTYVNRSSLQPHMKIQHGADGLIAWKRLLETTCLVCAERFAGVEQLTEHKLVHQQHQCTICKRRFQSRVTLELHVQKHSKKERHHKCDICGAQYPCSFTLRIHHRRAHTDERPFRCGQCALGFVERWELNAHMKKQHTFLKSLRAHQCKECAETFRTVDSLRVHMERHTGRYRYQCKVCLRNQHSGPLLVQHMQSYHMAEWQAEEAEKDRAMDNMELGGQGVL